MKAATKTATITSDAATAEIRWQGGPLTRRELNLLAQSVIRDLIVAQRSSSGEIPGDKEILRLAGDLERSTKAILGRDDDQHQAAQRVINEAGELQRSIQSLHDLDRDDQDGVIRRSAVRHVDVVIDSLRTLRDQKPV